MNQPCIVGAQVSGIAVSCGGYLCTPTETGSTLEAIRGPALLIHGDKDNLIPVDYRWEVSHCIPNVELVIIKGGGHECLVSRQWKVHPLLNAFLRKHAPT